MGGQSTARTWSTLLRPPSPAVMASRQSRTTHGPFRPWADGELYKRCDNACVCECGLPYWRHPFAADPVDWNGEPWLTALCDGTLAKL